jgi:hypothetical protein
MLFMVAPSKENGTTWKQLCKLEISCGKDSNLTDDFNAPAYPMCYRNSDCQGRLI